MESAQSGSWNEPEMAAHSFQNIDHYSLAKLRANKSKNWFDLA